MTEQRHATKNLIGLKLRERDRSHKPAALREEGNQQHQGDEVMGADGLGDSLGRHDGLT
jgi:hypothetical protein